MDGIAGFVFADERGERGRSADFDAVDGGDDVFVFQAGFVGGGVFLDGGGVVFSGRVIDIGAGVDRKLVLFGDAGGNSKVIDAKEGAGGGAGFEKLGEHAFDARDGDGEAEIVARAGGGIDTDDFACGVDERATGVAGVDGGVGLNKVGKIFVGRIGGVGGGDGAAGAGDDAGGDGVGELTESVTDGDNLLTDGNGFGIAEFDGSEVAGVVDF